MPFRFRRSARLGPLRFNFGKSGLKLDLPGRPWSVLQHPGSPLRWRPNHRGTTWHGSELERRAQP